MRGLLNVLLSTILILLIAISCDAQGASESSEDIVSTLENLDEVIEQRQSNVRMHLDNIERMKRARETLSESSSELFELNYMIADLYESFQFDSALYFLNRNYELARQRSLKGQRDAALLRMAHLYSTAGHYFEAAEILDQRIDTTHLDSALWGSYYLSQRRFHSEMREYSKNVQQKRESDAKVGYYTKRVLEFYPSDSDTHLRYLGDRLIDCGLIDSAEVVVDTLLAREVPSSHNYAIYAYTKSMIRGYRGDADGQICWLARSAMADMQSATKDHASMCLLAQILFASRNEVGRAFGYIQISMDDAAFYNARLRPWQIASVLPIIEQTHIHQTRGQLRVVWSLIVALAALFVLTLIFAIGEIRRKRRIEQMRSDLEQKSRELSQYVARLYEINQRQSTLMGELREANTVKEEYIGLFLGLCSDYIDKFEEYRRLLRKRLSHSKDELERELKSSELTDSYVEEFYDTFDNAFLRLYPTFVEEFNSLLQDDCHIEPKKGRLLNTELRIFALIRLGITDSSKIAGLLRYSVNTIYNYRAKVKNSAKESREDFEQRIKSIGAYASVEG